MIELQKLRYFVAVAETLNVGKAAAALHISQSPLSRQIIALEERLGTALFVRERKRLQLTETGRRFLSEAKILLEHAQQIEQRIRDEAEGRTGSLTLGFVEGAIHAGVLQVAIKRFLKAAPHSRIELKNLRSRQQFEGLQFGGIDVGFTYSPPLHNSALVADQVADEKFTVVMPRGHPLAKGRFDPHCLDGAAFIALPESESPEARQSLLAACARAGFMPNIRFEAADPSVVLGLVESGLGLAIVQKSLEVTASSGLVFRSLPSSFPLRARIFRVTRKVVRPLVARFLESQ